MGAESRSFRGDVNILGEILCGNLLLELIDRGLGLGGRQFRLDARRARITKAPFLVPTQIQARPPRALRTLAEIGLGFFDGLTKGAVVSGPCDGALDFVSARAGTAQHTAENITRRAQSARRQAGH
jgi:hypothetical protein